MARLRQSAIVRTAACLGGAGLLFAMAAPPAGASVFAGKMQKSPLAGYTATTTVTSVDATVTLPTFTCKSKSDAIASELAVIDTDTDEVSGAIIAMGCPGNKKVLTLEAELAVEGTPSLPAVTLNPGDTVVMSTSCGATGTTVTIDDTTSNTSGQATSSAASSCAAVIIGDGGFAKGKGSATAPLPNFGAIDYTDVTVNGDSLASAAPTATNYFEGKKAIITTGAIASDGTDFTTTQG
jgi:peptidase A4-like protein